MSLRKPAPLVVTDVMAAPLESVVPSAPQKGPTVSHHPDDQLSINLYNFCPNKFTEQSGRGMLGKSDRAARHRVIVPLYTPEERRRRDASPWTTVQAALAPVQFAIFLVSLCLVLRYLTTGEGLLLATASVVVKTIALYAIMVTGSIWEREVFGRYLFARPFFWEDVFSILVLGLHTIYLAALATGALAPREQMFVALAAYASYVVNATQFLLKLRAARRGQAAATLGAVGVAS
jgi:3-vinyl bacteriochlorophyllide hydratase